MDKTYTEKTIILQHIAIVGTMRCDTGSAMDKS